MLDRLVFLLVLLQILDSRSVAKSLWVVVASVLAAWPSWCEVILMLIVMILFYFDILIEVRLLHVAEFVLVLVQVTALLLPLNQWETRHCYAGRWSDHSWRHLLRRMVLY